MEILECMEGLNGLELVHLPSWKALYEPWTKAGCAEEIPGSDSDSIQILLRSRLD